MLASVVISFGSAARSHSITCNSYSCNSFCLANLSFRALATFSPPPASATPQPRFAAGSLVEVVVVAAAVAVPVAVATAARTTVSTAWSASNGIGTIVGTGDETAAAPQLSAVLVGAMIDHKPSGLRGALWAA